MWKHHWWKSSHRQCRRCGRYNAEKIIKETENWFLWRCSKCGFRRKHEISWAIWKQKNGKTFMKRNGWKRFQEVEVKNFGKYLKIVPANQRLRQEILL